MLEKNVVPIQAAVVAALEKFPDLIVEKARRLPHPDAMLEISAKWLGLGSDQDDVLRILKREFSDEALGAAHAKFHVARVDESIELLFAGTYDDNRFLTGRVLVTF
jgi:hypothetical protein